MTTVWNSSESLHNWWDSIGLAAASNTFQEDFIRINHIKFIPRSIQIASEVLIAMCIGKTVYYWRCKFPCVSTRRIPWRLGDTATEEGTSSTVRLEEVGSPTSVVLTVSHVTLLLYWNVATIGPCCDLQWRCCCAAAVQRGTYSSVSLETVVLKCSIWNDDGMCASNHNTEDFLTDRVDWKRDTVKFCIPKQQNPYRIIPWSLSKHVWERGCTRLPNHNHGTWKAAMAQCSGRVWWLAKERSIKSNFNTDKYTPIPDETVSPNVPSDGYTTLLYEWKAIFCSMTLWIRWRHSVWWERYRWKDDTRRVFGLSPQVTATLWSRIVYILREGTQLKHLFWALLSLKQYEGEPVNESITGVSRKTFHT